MESSRAMLYLMGQAKQVFFLSSKEFHSDSTLNSHLENNNIYIILFSLEPSLKMALEIDLYSLSALASCS